MSIAVYPGTFDPATRGHLDLIERGARLFDKLIVAVGVNIKKTPLFDDETRVAMLQADLDDMGLPNVEIKLLDGLAVNFCKENGATIILRGLRTVSDFESEFQMALTNRTFAKDIETVFVMPTEKYAYTSSSLIKEAASMGGDVSPFVTDRVRAALKEKLT